MPSEPIALILFLASVFAAASTGAIFKPGDWYESLRKPSWRPPNWLFPIAWTALYIMIAVSAYRIWVAASAEAVVVPMAAYGVQLALNAAWSAIFFGMRRMGLALAELVLLWLSIVAMIVLFHPIDALAAWLLAPYLVWVSFAGVLNATVWAMNRDHSASPAT